MDAPNGNAAPAAPPGSRRLVRMLVVYLLLVLLSSAIVCISMVTTHGFATGDCSNHTDSACHFVNPTHMKTSHVVADGFYFSIVSMLTIGFGDIQAITPWARFVTSVVVILGYTLTPALVKIISTEAGLLTAQTDWWIGLSEDRKRRYQCGFAFLIVSLTFLFGFLIARTTGNDTGDSIFLVIATVTTEGYGNISYNTFYGKIFSTIWLAVLLPFFHPAWTHLTSVILTYVRSLVARFLIWAVLQPADASGVQPLPPVAPVHVPNLADQQMADRVDESNGSGHGVDDLLQAASNVRVHDLEQGDPPVAEPAAASGTLAAPRAAG